MHHKCNSKIVEKMRLSLITLVYTSVHAQDGTPNGYCWRQFQKELEICGEAWTQLPECQDGFGFDRSLS